ncbi:MAG TPA: transcriptional regulator [Spirochaetia bacterium]|nr:transcriptional regulator [Spirochaetia bacterium]
MSDPFIDNLAREDFNRARSRETFTKIINLLTPERQELLSLQDVRQLIKPKAESYVGMKVVSIDLIVGSEGRYRDFDHTFLPRHEYVRKRWENVDKAHLKDIILPPIKLYEIGGVYFVRDGNHRVSVARSQGVKSIDAEVISLASELAIRPGMTRQDLTHAVIEYEKENAFENSELGKIISPDELNFTATGRYEEILKHIQVHKYFLNLDKTEEIPFVEAGKSWYEEMFKPIVNLIEEENLLSRFPGRTQADLYMWLIKHWDDLKRKYGNNFPLEYAVLDYSAKYGTSMLRRITELLAPLLGPLGRVLRRRRAPDDRPSPRT